MRLRTALFAAAIAAALPLAIAASPPAKPPGAKSVLMGDGIAPGAWHTSTQLTAMTGMPRRNASGQLSDPVTSDDCVKSSDIDAIVKDNLSPGPDVTCTQNSANAAHGAISGTATCSSEGVTGTLKFAGTYTPTHVDIAGNLAAQAPFGPITEHIHIVSDHTGTC